MPDMPIYVSDQLTLQVKRYNTGITYLTCWGTCHDIDEPWHALITYRTEDAAEAALDDVVNILHGWQEFGPLGASMQLPIHAAGG